MARVKTYYFDEINYPMNVDDMDYQYEMYMKGLEEQRQLEEQKLNFDLVDYEEYTNPDYVVLKLANGKKLEFAKKHIKNGKQAYQTLLYALDNYNNDEKCKTFIKKVIDHLIKQEKI